MDTFKEKQNLDERYTRGNAPWEVWRQPPADEPSDRPQPTPVLPADDLTTSGVTQPA
jgi:hypothetical protein